MPLAAGPAYARLHRTAGRPRPSRSSISRCPTAAGWRPTRTSPSGGAPKQQIAHMARHDALTDLPNRVLLRERLEQALTHDPPRRAAGGAVSRPRPLQGRQRHARPSGRRRAAEGGGRAAARTACARPTRWRGSAATSSPSSRPAPSSRSDASDAGAACLRGDRARPSIWTATRSIDRHQHRHRDRAGRRHRARRAAQERRHGALPRQGRRPRHLSLLRAGDGCAHAGAPRARTRSAQGARRAGEFELHYQPLVNLEQQPASALRGAAALEPSRARHRLARPSSFRWRRRPA